MIEMVWEEQTPFDAIELQYSLSEVQTIKIMRKEL